MAYLAVVQCTCATLQANILDIVIRLVRRHDRVWAAMTRLAVQPAMAFRIAITRAWILGKLGGVAILAAR
jgi:hypothetical protein